MPKVFVTKQTEFCPRTCPVIGFARDSYRDKLLKDYSPDDCIAIIGTKEAPTRKEDRGRIIGIATFHEKPTDDAESLVGEAHHQDPTYYNAFGEYSWPFAVKIKEAWIFQEPPLTENVIGTKLGRNTGNQVMLLNEKSESDVREILALLEHKGEKIPVGDKVDDSINFIAENAGDKKYNHTKKPTRGPSPSSHSVSYERDASGPAYTYIFRFSNSNIWKIGWAKDVENRLKEINKHVPQELLQQEWQKHVSKKYNSQGAANAVEQALLKLLTDKRTCGERVQCSEQELQNAWIEIRGNISNSSKD